jgi:hypothetical protein
MKVNQFEVIHFQGMVGEEMREVILLYALAADGNIYECSGGVWTPLSITPLSMRKTPKEKRKEGEGPNESGRIGPQG